MCDYKPEAYYELPLIAFKSQPEYGIYPSKIVKDKYNKIKLFGYKHKIIFDHYTKYATNIICNENELIRIDENDLNKYLIFEEVLPIKICQFKIARCGSTLLNNMLWDDKKIKIVSEPIIINDICEDNLLTREEKIKYLKLCFRLLSLKNKSYQVNCFIDLNSQVIYNYDLIKETINDNNIVYLTRDPLMVSQSLLKSPPVWLNTDTDIYESISEYIINSYKIVLESTNIYNIFDYEEILNFEYIHWIYKKLGYELDTELINKMKLNFKYHSKSGESFNNDYTIETANPRIKELLENNSILNDFKVFQSDRY